MAGNRRLLLCGSERLDGVGEDFNHGFQSGNLLPHFEGFLLTAQVRGTAARSIELSAFGTRVTFVHGSFWLQGRRHLIAVGNVWKARAEADMPHGLWPCETRPFCRSNDTK